MKEPGIPLVDLKIQHAQIADEIARGMAEVIEGTSFILGDAVARFERAFADFVGVRHCIGVGNGTDALEFAYRAAGVGEGDEVILPANTFIATALAAVRFGARPVLVDCDPVHYMIDAEQVARKIGPRTRAIVPVHLYGQVAPMEAIVEMARGHAVAVVEDMAQAQGARRGGACAGTFGSIAATSFYPGKNLGAYGDGGAVLTSSDAMAERIRGLRNFGSEVKNHHPEVGFNSRLDPMQAVVLSAKLRRLEAWNEERRVAAARYGQLLAGAPRVTLPAVLPGNEHAFHLYVVRVPDRDAVLARLHTAGVFAGIHYPRPIHLQGALADLGHRRGDFPVAERAADEVLSLPLYPGITSAQQARVAEELRKAVA